MIQQDLPYRGAGLLRLRFTARSQADDRKLAAQLQPPLTTRIPGPHPAGRVSCETIPQPLLLTGSEIRGGFTSRTLA